MLECHETPFAVVERRDLSEAVVPELPDVLVGFDVCCFFVKTQEYGVENGHKFVVDAQPEAVKIVEGKRAVDAADLPSDDVVQPVQLLVHVGVDAVGLLRLCRHRRSVHALAIVEDLLLQSEMLRRQASVDSGAAAVVLQATKERLSFTLACAARQPQISHVVRGD